MRMLATAVILLAASAAEAEELFRSKVAAIEEFPRVVPRGRKLTIQGKLQGRYRAPELIIIAPRGKTYLNPDNSVSDKDFIFRIKFTEGKGPYRLEIIARNQNRIVSAARVHVFYGMRRPFPKVRGSTDTSTNASWRSGSFA